MKKVLLSTAILGSLILGMIAPVTANAAIFRDQTIYITCLNKYCPSKGAPAPYDDTGAWYKCRLCGYRIMR
ncbi:hypothetical protein [Clostridium sp. LP20]|uniref:hypothetical protein n=1 Tax=Clostridium sp. LP20 TaxID=3418665 RepID=UPI003EE78FDF